MNRQIAVLGLGRFGSSVVEALVKHRVDVLAIDHNPENVQSISEIATYAVQCDATDVKALRAVNAQDVDAAVVSMGQDVEATILIVMILKDLGIKDIIAK
ncbi:MAG TPA: TrkA family potassium uptake protein, partial [Nitrospirales bacterium]|nr:TrkA family potassium uptake protein [Nitrospirales bacterium]